ncbi:MAG: aminodeoxychorismate lyase [Alcanivoracaceae bacterium]
MSTPVSSHDRGLCYGDGLFETLRVAAGRAPLWDAHRARLLAGAARLGIPLPAALDEVFASRLADTAEGIIKIIVTHGVGGRGYSAPDPVLPTLLVESHPLRLPASSRYQDGLTLGVCDIRLASQPMLAGIKHLNRLEQVLARRQVDAEGWDEGLVLGAAGEPLELTAMNLFARFGDELWTADLGAAGVAGVMRDHVIRELAPSRGLEVRVASGTLSRLQQADELFACNSVAGILPVRKLADWSWPVGETTRAMQTEVQSLFSGC